MKFVTLNAGCWTSILVHYCTATVAKVWQVQWTKLYVDIVAAINIDASTSVSSTGQFYAPTHVYWRLHCLYLVIERNSVSTSCIRSILRLSHEYVSDLHPTLCSGKISITDEKNSQVFYKVHRSEVLRLYCQPCESSIKQEWWAKCINAKSKEKKMEKRKASPFSSAACFRKKLHSWQVIKNVKKSIT